MLRGRLVKDAYEFPAWPQAKQVKTLLELFVSFEQRTKPAGKVDSFEGRFILNSPQFEVAQEGESERILTC